jgi:predicted negative regulator of RcsB-dependent stress response
MQDHLGDAYFHLRRLPEARQAWEKSLVSKPDNPTVEQKLRNVRSLMEEALHGAPDPRRP